MSLVGLLIGLLILVLIVYVAKLIVDALIPQQPARNIVLAIIALIALLILLRLVLVGGSMHPFTIP